MTSHLRLAALAAALATAGATADVERYQLDNGLTVVLRPVPGAAQVACLVLFDIGNLHDPPGRSGLAHLVEHVYVTGAAGQTPASNAMAWFQRYQGQVNAQTGRDYTVIATVTGREALQAELAEAAARMGGLRIEQDDLDREKPRLVQELDNMYGGIPTLAAQNYASLAAAPLNEGARHGGVAAQVEAVTVDEVRAHHGRYYKPVNARLVLAGGFDPAAARQHIRQHFAPLEAGLPAPAPASPARPSTGAIRRVTVAPPALGQFPRAIAALAYRAPGPDSDCYAAFLVLAGGLYQHFMPELQAAMSKGSPIVPLFWTPLDRPDVLVFSAEVDAGQSDDDVVAALRRTVADRLVGDDGRRAAGFWLRGQLGPMLGLTEMPPMAAAMNPYGLAFSIGRADQRGIDGPALSAQIDAVSAEDLRRCAEAVFGETAGAAAVVRINSGS